MRSPSQGTSPVSFLRRRATLAAVAENPRPAHARIDHIGETMRQFICRDGPGLDSMRKDGPDHRGRCAHAVPSIRLS
jgi:hypothetical protein